MPDIPIRSATVSVFILRPARGGHEALLLRRRGTLEGQWCQVAGKLEPGERAWEAALREVREETGLAIARLYSADYCEQFYEPERDAISIIPVFVGFVEHDAAVTLNEEHSEFRWVSFDEAANMVAFPSQRAALEFVKREFVERSPPRALRIRQSPVDTEVGRFACPCCLRITLPDPPGGTYFICPVCYWEDDNVQLRDPTLAGGANQVSLCEARENFVRFGASDRRSLHSVQAPRPEEIPTK